METASSAEETSESSTSMKGLKAVSSLVISGGAFTIDAADDTVHSNAGMTVSGGTFAIATGDDGLNAAGGTDGSGSTGGRDGRFGGGWMGGGRGGRGGMGGGFSSASSEGSIAISGGTLTIQASGDGLDANGTIEITGGTTVVTGPTSGDTAVPDYDTSAAIAGGTFLGTGAAQTFRSAEQGVVTERVSGEAGEEIVLADASGTALLTLSPALDFQFIVLSSPDLVSGETYTLPVGGASTEVQAG